MGKKQHQKDKLYLTTTEWKNDWGGKKDKAEGGFRRLPFDHCALSLQPFEHPMCADDGTVYDITNIVPFIKKYGINPATGEKLDPKSLVKLNFSKNAAGEYHCPVTYKVFNEHSHIVAIRTTGNVYSFDAVDRLNVKAKNWKDLLTDEPFVRRDIITISDPTDTTKRNINTFHHVKNNIKLTEDAGSAQNKIRHVNAETSQALAELYATYKEPERAKADTGPVSNVSAHFSTNAVAGSFTSTAAVPVTINSSALVDVDTVRYAAVKGKGYVRVTTNLGELNLELFCQQVPRTCDNFIQLATRGYYNNTTFHRSIKHFMIQGGDPTGTGRGGESAWVVPFKDEFKKGLNHTDRGILSMANRGPHTNTSQFFITYRPAPALDGKHTVFGRLVGGMETLAAMERVAVDDADKPKEPIQIISVQVFVNPFDALKEEEAAKAEADRQLADAERNRATALAASSRQQQTYKEGVGKYIAPATQALTAPGAQGPPGHVAAGQGTMKRKARDDDDVDGNDVGIPSAVSTAQPKSKKTAVAKSGFGDFSAW